MEKNSCGKKIKRKVVLKKNPIAIASSEGIIDVDKSQNKVDKAPNSCSKYTGKFCWEEIDGIAVPFIIRSSGELLAEINMLKKSLFKKQLKVLHKSIFDMACSPKKYQATRKEKLLLNEINSVHCDYYFNKQPNMPCAFLLAKEEIIKLYEVLKVFYNLVTQKTINDTNGGYILIDNSNTPVPFVCVKGIGLIVPLFFFECPELKRVKFKLRNHWALVYLKLLCKLLSIVKIFKRNTLAVVRLENLKERVPEIREFTFITTLPSSANILELAKATKAVTRNMPNKIKKLPKIAPKNIQAKDNEKTQTEPQSKGIAPENIQPVDKFEKNQIEPPSINNSSTNNSSTLSGSAPYFTNPLQVATIPSGGYILQAPPILMPNSYVLNPLSGVLTPVSSAGYLLPFQGTTTEQGTEQQQGNMQQTPINMNISNSVVIVQQDKNTASIIPEASTNLIQNLPPGGPTSTMQHVTSTHNSPLEILKAKTGKSVKNVPFVASTLPKKRKKILTHDLGEVKYEITEIPDYVSVTYPLSYRVETITLDEHKFVCISNLPTQTANLLINVLDVKKFLFPEVDGKKFMSEVYEMKLVVFSLNTVQRVLVTTYFGPEKKDIEYLYFLLHKFVKVYNLLKITFTPYYYR